MIVHFCSFLSFNTSLHLVLWLKTKVDFLSTFHSSVRLLSLFQQHTGYLKMIFFYLHKQHYKKFYIKCIITNSVIMRMFKYNIFYDIFKPFLTHLLDLLSPSQKFHDYGFSCNLRIYEKLDDYFCNAKKCKFRRRVLNFSWSSIQFLMDQINCADTGSTLSYNWDD